VKSPKKEKRKTNNNILELAKAPMHRGFENGPYAMK
jgi:hypothetical protein